MNRLEKLGQNIRIRTGYLSRTGIREDPGADFCLIQLGDFDPSRTKLNLRDLVRFDPGDLRKDQTIRPGEVLFLAKGVNNFAYLPGPLSTPTLAASYFYVLTPSPVLLPEYLCWFLNHPHTRRKFDRIAGVGSRMPVVKTSDLADIEIPLPPLADQKQIVRLHAIVHHEAELLDRLKHTRKTFANEITMKIANAGQPRPLA